MHVSKIVLTMGCTINTGNYENIRRDVQVEVVSDTRNDVMFEYAEGKARQFLAESLVEDFWASFDVTLYSVRAKSEDDLRRIMERTAIFPTIAANDPDRADELVNEQWEKLEAFRTAQAIKDHKAADGTNGKEAAESEDDEIPFELYDEREIDDEPGDN